MDQIVILYLWLSILLYVLFGGADFGAGIIELLTSKKNRSRTRQTLYHAIGPIWEANHMWLIIAIVILFVGFPEIYSVMSVYLHIPLALMLLGIIARGTAFIFRHYDAIKDQSQRIYNKAFIWSSFVTPLFLGIIAGSAVSGTIDPNAKDFVSAYLAGWLNLFSISVGLFTVSLCGFLAAVYLIAEADNEHDRQRFIRKARIMNIASVLSGAIVFMAALADGVPLFSWVFESVTGIAAVTCATVAMVANWFLLNNQNIWIPRILAGGQVVFILLAVTAEHYPDFIILKGATLSLETHHAPVETINSLGWALLLGSIFILPALYYLYYSFKSVPSDDSAT